MSIGAITSLAVQNIATGRDEAQAVQAPQRAPQAQTVANAQDTVQLTEAERVYQLYIQGQKVSQIAAALSLPVQAVDSYLNLTTSGS